MKTIRRPHNALLYFGILSFLYLVLQLILPESHKNSSLYHLSALQYHVLLLFVTMPLIAIWFVAFYSYSKIKEYAAVIAETEEGPAFAFIADGLMWLAWGLPIPALIGVVASGIANSHPGFYAASVIITNYANLIVPLIAFHILSSGSRTLLEHAGLRISIISTKLLVFFFVLLGAVYTYFVFHNIGTSLGGTNNPYDLPVWIMLLTIVVPYLYAWFLGLLAAYELHLIAKNATGLLYRQAMQHLTRGLVVVVGSSIALLYLRSVLPHNNKISLGYMLVLIYAILAVIALGYALLAYGAQKLKRIEEV